MSRRSERIPGANPSRIGREGGFTLIEVVAALLISAVALTCILQSETWSVRSASRTADLREASILGGAKLQELATGGEAESSGSFESREDWAWEAVREPVEGGFGAERIILTVTYGPGGSRKTLQLEQIVQ